MRPHPKTFRFKGHRKPDHSGIKEKQFMKFEDLRLIEPILRAVASEGYTTPTPIQSKTIPQIMAGRDLLGCARTGTGKTGAFALPILHRLAAGQSRQPKAKGQHRSGKRNERHGARSIRTLVLAPTRELAAQIHESFRTYGRNLPLRHAVIFGGVNQNQQVRALRAGVEWWNTSFVFPTLTTFGRR